MSGQVVPFTPGREPGARESLASEVRRLFPRLSPEAQQILRNMVVSTFRDEEKVRALGPDYDLAAEPEKGGA